MDLKLRKRAIAALGEILFYISAQDEDPTSDTGSAEEKAARGGGVGAAPATEAKTKWLVPDTAFTAILKALRDDPDEVVRHYAAKVGDIVVEVNVVWGWNITIGALIKLAFTSCTLNHRWMHMY